MTLTPLISFAVLAAILSSAAVAQVPPPRSTAPEAPTIKQDLLTQRAADLMRFLNGEAGPSLVFARPVVAFKGAELQSAAAKVREDLGRGLRVKRVEPLSANSALVIIAFEKTEMSFRITFDPKSTLLVGLSTKVVATPSPVVAHTELPFSTKRGLIVVPVKIEGKEVRMILDTGAALSGVVDTPRGAALGLDTSKARPLGRAGEKDSPVGQLHTGLTVQLGSATLGDQMVVAARLASMPCAARVTDVDADGVLGGDVFKRYVVSIDFDRQIASLDDPGTFAPPTAALATLPIAPLSGEGPQMLGSIKAVWTGYSGVPQPIELLLDTGSNQGVSLFTRTKPEITPPAGAEPHQSCMVGGTRTYLTGGPTSLALGDARVTNVDTSYGPPIGSHGWNGLLGMGVLSTYNLVIDGPRGRLYLLARRQHIK